MLRVVSHKSAAAARQYYAEGLKREDYYSEGQEIVGKWYGKAAKMLGLDGNVTPEQFAAMVENRHPVTGKRLTPRNVADRIVGYDLNFHAPKSLSVLYALTGEKALLNAFRDAVAGTMAELEERAATRIRKKGAAENRTTGNLAWAEFVHLTSRPVGGIPDPHLHIHCFAFNATFDQDEGRWKAAKFREIKKEAPYGEAVFHSRLSAALADRGYAIERTKNSWEIKGVPTSVLAKFSRRTAQIERLAAEKGITDARAKDALGAASREGKRHGLKYTDLLAAWNVRLTDAERASIFKVCQNKTPQAGRRITPEAALDHAELKLFERNSVVPQTRLLAEAMRYGVGQTTPEAIKAEFKKRPILRRQIGEELLCTTEDVLLEELSLINFVRTGRAQCAPLWGKGYRLVNSLLSEEQKAAVRHVLESTDQVIGIRGGAGVGKTTLMKEIVSAVRKEVGFAIEGRNRKVFAFAPSASASRETLREEGFANANTVAYLLANEMLQKQVRGNVIWIDEAGLVGVQDLCRIMEIAGEKTRVILTGDIFQHGPVSRGDGFRLLQDHAGLQVAEVTQIRRQQTAEYKEAVAALAKGDLRTAFRRLDKMGAITEIQDDQQRYLQIAKDYLQLAKSGSTPLVVSPTHAEGAKVTDAIRSELRAAKKLGVERDFVRFQDLKWEEAERKRPENYREGLVVQFNQNTKGIIRGELFHVAGRNSSDQIELVGKAGRKVLLPLNEAKKFQVYEERQINLAKGDQIRITANGKTADGRRISNGNVFKIEEIGKDGQIVLNTGARLNPEQGLHIAYGYCQTSHSAQSKSVRDVLIAQSEASFVASSLNQFYVSCSRAKQSIRIFTDSRQGLQEAVGNPASRMAGIELANLSKEEISAFMSDDTKWRDMIQSRRESSKSFVETLLKERRQDGNKKPENSNWGDFIKMQRAKAGPDGKSRAKVKPAEPGKSRIPQTGALPKTSLHTDSTTEKWNANKEKSLETKTKVETKPQSTKPQIHSTRMARARAGIQSAKTHFKQLTDRVRARSEAKPPPPPRQINVGNSTLDGWRPTKKHEDRVAKSKVTQHNLQAAKKTQQPVRQPIPAPRRGK